MGSLARWHQVKAVIQTANVMRGWLRLEDGLEVSLAKLKAALKPDPDGTTGHEHYIRKLCTGRHAIVLSNAVADQRDQRAKLTKQAEMAAHLVTEVQTNEEAAKVELWQQGNHDMYNDEAIEQRLKMRRDPRVRKVLDTWWSTAVRGADPDFDGDELDATLSFQNYTMMMRRLYRVMLSTFDEVDAMKQITEDWHEDTKGKDVLSRRLFQDAIFQLADLWTGGICPYEYAAFAKTLLDKIMHITTVIGPNGEEITISVWKDEADCVHDPEMFADKDADGQGSYREQAKRAVQESAEMKAAAVCIQKHARKKKGNEMKKQRKAAIVKIQSSSRGRIARRQSKKIASNGASKDDLGLGAEEKLVSRRATIAERALATDFNATHGLLYDPRMPPGGYIREDGIIFDANGNPVLGTDGEPLCALGKNGLPLYILANDGSLMLAPQPPRYSRSTRATGFLDFLDSPRKMSRLGMGGKTSPRLPSLPSKEIPLAEKTSPSSLSPHKQASHHGYSPHKGTGLPPWWSIVRLDSRKGSRMPRRQLLQYDSHHARPLPALAPLPLPLPSPTTQGTHSQWPTLQASPPMHMRVKPPMPQLTSSQAPPAARATHALCHPMGHPTVLVSVSHSPRNTTTSFVSPRQIS